MQVQGVIKPKKQRSMKRMFSAVLVALLKVILKPTKKFPNGYFYTDDNEITRELIESYSWFLHHCGRKNINVSTSSFNGLSLKFHRDYAYRVLGYYPDYIDHIDGLEINNLDRNLNIVNNIQIFLFKPLL